jgi:magnesium chelatase subunit I
MMSVPEHNSQAEDQASSSPIEPSENLVGSSPQSLRELLDIVSGKRFLQTQPLQDSGLAEPLPLPFLALVGQQEMKIALLLAIINPLIGGVLLIGPRGTGKTTAVRSLLDLLPDVRRSKCFYGCLPEDIESGGIDAVCPECARKYGMGESLTELDRVHLIELPLNAQLEDVIGCLNDNDHLTLRQRIRRGILSQADQNILYIDEVNILANEIVDAILDASAQGLYIIRRGSLAATYRSRFTLIGSMNPEEGKLRPQIMDRFGLRVVVKGLEDLEERLEAYRRVRTYRENPRGVISEYEEDTQQVSDEIQSARELLPDVHLPDEIARLGIRLIQNFNVDSLRAEITLFEAARAFAAIDGRTEVQMEDLRKMAPMAIRFRQSEYMEKYLAAYQLEEEEIQQKIDGLLK